MKPISPQNPLSKNAPKQKPGIASAAAVKAFDIALSEAVKDYEEQFNKLRPVERSMVVRWLEETLLTGNVRNGVIGALNEHDYIRTPVSMEEFLTDHSYIGGVFTDKATESSIDVLARPWVDDLIHVFDPGNEIYEWLMTGSIGIGKLQRLDDDVLTPKGWKQIGTVKVGDYVIGSNGHPTRVEGVYPHKDVQLYKVRFTDGAYLDVGEDHLWEVSRQHRTAKARTWKTEVVDTKTLADRKLKDGENWTHRIPLVSPVHYSQVDNMLTVPAYTLGALLGDGCFTKGTVTLAGDDLEMGDRVQSELVTLDVNRATDGRQWTISRGKPGGVRNGNWLTKELRALKLWGKGSLDKWIPERYLKATPEDRLELLRGLMDADGHITDGNCAVFSTSSPLLARDVRELVLSLGGVCCDTSFNRDGSMEYQVKVNLGDVCPFYLQRKVTRWKPRTNQQPRRAIVSVEKIDRADGVCIKVAARDQLYVARDFIVTHNTTIAAIGLVYTVYRLSCLRNPARYYGLPANSMFVCQAYSITKKQVSDAGYSMVKSFIDASPYFREEFPRSPKIETVLDFTPTTHIPLKISGGCVAVGTLIETPSGPVSIEKLAMSSRDVYTLSKDGESIKAGYAGVIGSGVKKCLVLKTESGYNLTCSLDHKIWSPDKQDYTRAQDLQVGQEVLTLRHDQAGPRVLHAEREAAGEVQGLREDNQQQALSRDQDVQGQRVSADRFPETVQFVRGDQAAGSIWCEGQEEQVGGEEVPQVAVQAVRKLGYQGILSSKLESMSREEAEATYRSIRAGQGQRTESAVLQGESRGDLGEVVVARVSCRYPGACETVEEEESGQGTAVSPELAGAVSGKGSSPRTQMGHVAEGSKSSTCCQLTPQGTEAIVDGYAYFYGHRLRDGVLWGAVCLLRDNTDARYSHDGSRDSVERRWTDRSREYGAVLHDVQLPEEGFRPVQVCRTAESEEANSATRSHGSSFTLRRSRIVSIEDAGELPTFDVSDVDSTTHAIISNGVVSSNSQGFHGLGLNVFSFSMDEVNFMRQSKDSATGENVGQAYDVYNTLLTRVKSRFNRPGGTIPGIMLMMSSKNAQSSFIDEKVRQIVGRDNIDGIRGDLGSGTYLSDYRLWEVKKTTMFSGEWFRVEKGDRTRRSRILKPTDKPRVGAKIIEVPADFLRNFEEDVDKSLRDIAGESTHNVSPLIYDNPSVYDAIRKTLTHPFHREDLSLSEADDIMIEHSFDVNTLCKVVRSKWVPNLNPGAPRYIHVDLALTGDSAGIAMGHPSGKTKVRERNEDGTTTYITKPHIVIDFMLRIRPPRTTEIPLWKIRSFIMYLRQMFRIQKVTFDGFQSADSCQQLRHEGIKSDRLSVDKDDGPYLQLRSALQDRRVAYYEYEPFITEVLDLQHFMPAGKGKKRKVDHPDRASHGGPGSKDVSDAVCGVVFHCVNDPIAVAESLSGELIDPYGESPPKTKTADPDHPKPTKPALSGVNMAALQANLSKKLGH